MADHDWYEVLMMNPPSWQRLMESINSRHDVYKLIEYTTTEENAEVLLIPTAGSLLIRLTGFHWSILDSDADKEDVGVIIDGVWKKTGNIVKYYSMFWESNSHLPVDVGLERTLYIYHP